MSLEKRIMQDLKTAMKEKDEAAKRTIRAIKSAILLQKSDGSGTELNEEMEIKMLQKLIKQRQESLNVYTEQGRADLAQTEEEEINVLQRYLPEQMSEEDLKTFITDLITREGAEGMKDMGRIMGLASKELAGKADGKAISTIVKAQLGS